MQEFKFTTSDDSRLRLVNESGVFEGKAPGRATIVLKTLGKEHRFAAEVMNEKLLAMKVTLAKQVPQIRANEVLFIGHANRDGFDHTMVAKSGIDWWVRQFKDKDRPVIYLVSEEYPNWYTEDRNPTYAIISEGQEHDLQLDVPTIYFAGGGFAYCLLRNVQFVLHRWAREGGSEAIRLVFLIDAIWTGEKDKPYPAPMAKLDSLFDRAASPEATYDLLIVPFLNRLINEYPVTGYPDAGATPQPHLKALLTNVTIEVIIEDDHRRVYRSRSGRVIHVEFRRRSALGEERE